MPTQEPDQHERHRLAVDKLRDPDTFTLDVTDVADVLGVAYTTIYADIKNTGQAAGFPVIRAGRRTLVPAHPLRLALGIRLEHDQHDEVAER